MEGNTRREQLFTTKQAAIYLSDLTGTSIPEYILYKPAQQGELVGRKSENGRWSFTQDVLDTYAEQFLGWERPVHVVPEGSDDWEGEVDIPLLLEAEEEEHQGIIWETVDIPVEPLPQSPLRVTCYRCGRPFLEDREYLVEPFPENGVKAFYPVCRDGRCDPSIQSNIQKQLEQQRVYLIHLLAVLQNERDAHQKRAEELTIQITQYRLILEQGG